MKKLIAAVAIVPMLAACDIVLPSKTFTGGGIACWRGETTLETDAEAIKELGKLPIIERFSFPGIEGKLSDLQAPLGLSASDTAMLIAACKDFLR